jgi:3-hydroxyacyl-CoA dehydrogenase
MYRVNSSIVPAACRLSQTRGYASFFEEKPLAVAWFTPVGVLGSGIMGGGIASTAAINGLNVTMVDIKQELLDKAMKDAEEMGKKVFDFQVKRGKMKPAFAKKTLEDGLKRIKCTTDMNALNECDVVIESIVENLDIKKKALGDLGKVMRPGTIVGSNTSSLSITELGQYYSDPSAFCGIHFFNPVLVMQLVEVIRTKDTSDRTYNAAKRFSELLGKKVVTCGDTPGFIVNRLLVPYLTQACLMLDRGDATFSDIDKAMKLGAGMPQGPFQLADFVGLDTAQAILEGWVEKMPEEKIFCVPEALKAKVAEGKLGRKTGEGFWKWDGDKIVEV